MFKILVVGDDDFPQMLTTHSTLPPVIFAKGHTSLLNNQQFQSLVPEIPARLHKDMLLDMRKN